MKQNKLEIPQEIIDFLLTSNVAQKIYFMELITKFIVKEIKSVKEAEYDQGFSDGQMEAAGDCLCDCKKCGQCEFQKKMK